jgi:hypothetical protein
MSETWKDVVGFEGLYQVSSLGNVRSLNWRRTGKAKLMSHRKHNQGYVTVLLSKNGKQYSKTIHRLVAFHFVPGYANELEVNHIDRNRENNCADNLEWCSHKNNVLHSRGCMGRKMGEPTKDKRVVVQKDICGTVVKVWSSTIEAKHALGVSDWSIKQCCRGNQKTAYGFLWEYDN